MRVNDGGRYGDKYLPFFSNENYSKYVLLSFGAHKKIIIMKKKIEKLLFYERFENNNKRVKAFSRFNTMNEWVHREGSLDVANEEITRGRKRVKGKKNNMEMFEYSTMRRAIEFLCLLCELFLYSIDVSLCLIWEILLFCYYKNVFVNFKRFLLCLFFYLANECIHKYQKMSEKRAFIMWCENNVFLNLHSCSLVHSFNQNKSTVGCSQTILILLIPSSLDNVFGEIDCECNRKRRRWRRTRQ